MKSAATPFLEIAYGPLFLYRSYLNHQIFMDSAFQSPSPIRSFKGIKMWQTLNLGNQKAVVYLQDGWKILIERRGKDNYLISIIKPDDENFDLDDGRAPFLYADEQEFDIAAIFTSIARNYKLEESDTHFALLRDRVQFPVGTSPILRAMARAKIIRLDMFTLPRKVVGISLGTTGLPKALRDAFGLAY